MSRVGSSPVTCTKTSRRNTACFLLLIHFKTAVAELHQIFDFVVEETCFLGVKSMILRKRNLFRRLTKASPRCPSQYWRVGSSPVTCTKTSRRNTACFLLLIHFKTAVAELHQIFDLVVAELVLQTESASFRCR